MAGKGAESYDGVLQDLITNLRDDILRLPSGAAVGNEEQITARYSTSRGTFRKAAALLIRDGILEVRRGKAGGYFTRIPSADAVARSAAIYLRATSANFLDVIDATGALRAEMAVLACRNNNPELRAVLRATIDECRARTGKLTFDAYVSMDREIGKACADLAGNVVLNLFLESLIAMSSDNIMTAKSLYLERPERSGAQLHYRIESCEAILEGDQRRAVELIRDAAELVKLWLLADKTAKKGPPASIFLADKVVQ